MTNPTQPPRSAREQLLDQMARWGVFVDRASIEDADIVLDAHAHELAEQIRENPMHECPGAIDAAADLIDPEAQR